MVVQRLHFDLLFVNSYVKQINMAKMDMIDGRKLSIPGSVTTANESSKRPSGSKARPRRSMIELANNSRTLAL